MSDDGFMSVEKLIAALNEVEDKTMPVILCATDDMDYSVSHTVTERALECAVEMYSGHSAFYITDGSR